MNIEVSSDHILAKPEIDSDVQHSQVPNSDGSILSATSSKGEIAEDSTLTAQSTTSTLPNVASKSRPRPRRSSSGHENGRPLVAAANSAPNLAETVAERRAGQSGLADDSGNAADEAALAKKIGDLWSLVQFRTYRITCIKKELVVYQADLARELYRYKALLVGSGRSGKWSGFLREVKVPRATADRYVQKWENSLSPVKAISPPSTEEITRIVNRIKPNLLRVLTTADAVGQFMAALGAALQVPHSN
jgi:hypothetical protein